MDNDTKKHYIIDFTVWVLSARSEHEARRIAQEKLDRGAKVFINTVDVITEGVEDIVDDTDTTDIVDTICTIIDKKGGAM